MPFVEERRVGEDEDEDGVQWGQVGYVFVCCQGSIKLFKNGGCPDEDHALSYMSLRARTTMASPRGRGRSLHGSQGRLLAGGCGPWACGQAKTLTLSKCRIQLLFYS